MGIRCSKAVSALQGLASLSRKRESEIGESRHLGGSRGTAEPQVEPPGRRLPIVSAASFSQRTGEAPLCPFRPLRPFSPTHPRKVPAYPLREALLLSATGNPLSRSTWLRTAVWPWPSWIVRTKGSKGTKGTKGPPHRCFAHARHTNQNLLLPSALAQRANSQAFYMFCMFYTAKGIV